ncbi:hypothetical protein IKF03_01580 [Candidatus Saccharibacteria bacterium]|nr:hypothetical protein [Candidatus Saccharibacteria bacterium]
MNNDTSNEKKENWLRYGFWVIAGLVAIVAIFVLVNMTGNGSSGPNVPSDYKFVVEDHYPKSDSTWATYYVYDNYILVKKDSEAAKNDPMMIYDGIDSTKLSYDENDTTKICDTDSCYRYPKVLTTIKKLISKKVPREYTR